MMINKYDDDFVEVVLISLSIRFYLFLELSSSLRPEYIVSGVAKFRTRTALRFSLHWRIPILFALMPNIILVSNTGIMATIILILLLELMF